MIRILIVEKDVVRAGRIRTVLEELNYDVLSAADEEEALNVMGKVKIQLIVANSDSGGLELSVDLREAEDYTPLIVITENSSRAEKRRIFRSGADGYMVIPLDLEELQMRVRSLLWRCRIVDDATLRFGECSLHAETLTVKTPRGSIELRHMEFLLLEKLLSYPGRVFTRAQLMDELWGFDTQSDPRTVDTHIRRLRKKLQDVDEIRLLTVRGIGYRAAMPRAIRRAEKAKERNEID